MLHLREQLTEDHYRPDRAYSIEAGGGLSADARRGRATNEAKGKGKGPEGISERTSESGQPTTPPAPEPVEEMDPVTK